MRAGYLTFFLWTGQFMPSLQYLHFSSGTGGIAFVSLPYLRLGMGASCSPERGHVT